MRGAGRCFHRAAMSLRPPLWLLGIVALPALSGCVAKAVYNVATAPVRVVSGAVDATTTSQSEADENRGREMRRREERLGWLERSYRSHSQACAGGDQAACALARDEYAQIQQISPTVSAEPR